MRTNVSIPKERDGNEVVQLGSYRILETFAGPADESEQPVLDHVRHKMKRALRDFPELAGRVVTVGRLDPDDDVLGKARFWNLMVLYPVDDVTSWQTVYHELAHLAIHVRNQRDEDVPITSEEFCSIFAIARMPVDLLDEDRVAYLGYPSAPQEEWPEICERALEYREENGANSHYVQRAKEWLGTDDQ